MSNTTVPLQITVDGTDTFEGFAGEPDTLRVYTPALDGSRAAVDLLMTPDVVAEAIADLASTLRHNAAYGALAAAVEGFFESQAVAS